MADRTIFVTHEESAKVPDFVVKLSNLSIEAVVFGRIHFHFGLEISEPLFLSLSTFQSSDTVSY